MTAHRVLTDLYGANNDILDPGSSGVIRPRKDRAYVPLVTSGAETRTLPDPEVAGKQVTLGFKTDGGNCVITASTAINQSGNTIMTLADAGDEITLRSIEKGANHVWRVVSNDGVALSS
jgi:hypothetical protein